MSGKALTKNQIELITTLASQEAIKRFEEKMKEAKKKEKDWKLRNTKLLLENYKKLKNHCSDIEQQIDEYTGTVFGLEELTLETLMKYKIKTFKMMLHFDRMLKHYEEDCALGSEEEQRRYKVIYDRYLSENRLAVKQICEKYYVEQGTVYRDTKLAIHDLSVMLFGIVAL